MIIFVTENREGAVIMRLDGTFGADTDPALLIDHLMQCRGNHQAILDLTGVTTMTGPAVREFLLRLENAFGRNSTTLVHADASARRHLRSLTQRLPVLPTVELVLSARPSAPEPASPIHCAQPGGLVSAGPPEGDLRP